MAGFKEWLRTFFASGQKHPFVQWGLLAGGIGLGLIVILQLLSFQSETEDFDATQQQDGDQFSEETTTGGPNARFDCSIVHRTNGCKGPDNSHGIWEILSRFILWRKPESSILLG